ncbi:hypothetical protein QUA20_27795 [Microcoleus sp. Pol7_A1]|uniref:hypothetical protein n=1 Tax=Microcoleus sp. Pol7_A1 TaxID=2818893 RepID=UPI002FD27964
MLKNIQVRYAILKSVEDLKVFRPRDSTLENHPLFKEEDKKQINADILAEEGELETTIRCK